MIKNLINKWKNYRHRFLPWLALNLQHRIVPESVQVHHDLKGSISNTEIEHCLKEMMLAFESPCKSNESALIIFGGDSLKRRELFEKCGRKNREILLKRFGFDLEIKMSAMPGAGKGVFIKQGRILRGQVVALYPGTIYMPYQPILLPSFKNPYIFRCSDGVFIDGNYKGISAVLYRSIHGRDRIGSQIPICDISWLHLLSIINDENCTNNINGRNINLNMVVNPLNIGQIVNNCNPKIPGHLANLAYQEINIKFGESKNDTFKDFTVLGLIPNAYYKNEDFDTQENLVVKAIVLVAIKDVQHGEELLTTYFTLVNT